MLINSPNISGSLTVTGNSVISGSLNVLGSITGAITGSATTASYVEFANVADKPTLVSGSSQVTYSGLTGIPSGIVSGSSQVTYSGLTGIPSGIISGSAQVSFNGIVDKPTLVSGSAQVTYSGLTGIPSGIVSGSAQVSFNGIVDKPTLVSGSSQVTYSGLTGIPVGIVSGSAQIADFGIFATTGSNGFNGSQAITGSLTVTGAIVAQTLNVQQVTSSVVFSSGSNVFGNELGNTQQFTGSMLVTGSLSINGTNSLFNVNNGTLSADILTVRGGGSTGAFGFKVEANNGEDIFYTNNLTYDVIANPIGGKFGIGTTGPDRLFHINGNTTTTTPLQKVQNIGTGDAVTEYRITGVSWYVGIDNSDGDKFKIGQDPLGTSDRLTIIEGGNVGIGTTAPGAKLEIAGFSTGAGLKLNYGNSSGTIEAVNFIANGGANGVIGMQMVSAGVGDLWLGGSGGRALTLYRDGNVGIGTTSPTFKLDMTEAGAVISGTATAGSNMKGLKIFNSTTAVTNNAVGIWFSTGPHQAGIASFRAIADTTWETTLAFYTHIDTTTNLNDATEKMRITGNGNVGIGTATPSAISTFTTLDIRGATGGAIRMGKTSTSPFNLQHDGTDAYLNNVANGAMYFYTHDNERWRITSTGILQSNGAQTIQSSSGVLTIQPSGGVNLATSSGNVGIGTISPNPSSPLHVRMCSNSNGDGIRVQAICTGGAGSQPGIAFANTTDAKRWSISLDTTSDIIQITNANGASALVINQGGNVGLNCTSPSQLLTVNGVSSFKCHQQHPLGFWYKIPFNMTKETGVGLANTQCLVIINNNDEFQQLHFTIEYGSRLQGISDSYTQTSLRTYSVNRFIGATATLNDIYLITGGSGCNINTHAPVSVAIVGNCMSVVKVDFSNCLGGSSFVWGEVKIWSTEQLNNKITILNNVY